MRRVDGGVGDLQRGEGLIARPVPLSSWIDGVSEPHVDLLMRTTLSDGRAADHAALLATQASFQKNGGADGKRRSAETTSAPLSKKQKKTVAKANASIGAAPSPLLLGFSPSTENASSALSSGAGSSRPSMQQIKVELLATLGKDDKGRFPCFFHHHNRSCKFTNETCKCWHSK